MCDDAGKRIRWNEKRRLEESLFSRAGLKGEYIYDTNIRP